MDDAILSADGQVALPQAIRDRLGLEPGDAVGFLVTARGDVLLRRRPDAVPPLRKRLAHLASAPPPPVEAFDEGVREEVARRHAAIDRGGRGGG